MTTCRVGCCVTSHGLGHAARTLAVMESLARLVDVHFTVVSLVPEWFFRSSHSGPLTYIPLQTDVGLVQHSPLREDLPATIMELRKFYPLRRPCLDALVRAFDGCDLVLCDIAPAGIAAARRCAIPSVLLENFTWDWIYRHYSDSYPELAAVSSELARMFAGADHHIRAQPFCGPGTGDLVAGPVARGGRRPASEVRRRLGISSRQRMVLLSLGGGGFRNIRLGLPDDGRTVFVAPAAGEEIAEGRHIRLLQGDGEFFHPDLVEASDAVVGKVGYSTIAEAYRAEVPFGYISRQGFPESGPLEAFIKREMAGVEIDENDLATGRLADRLPELCDKPVPPRRHPDGAHQCGLFLYTLLTGHSGGRP